MGTIGVAAPEGVGEAKAVDASVRLVGAMASSEGVWDPLAFLPLGRVMKVPCR